MVNIVNILCGYVSILILALCSKHGALVHNKVHTDYSEKEMGRKKTM